MVTVETKEGLKQAINNKETKILVAGELAKQMRKKSKVKKVAKTGGIILAIGSAIAIPFTAGASTAGVVAGVSTATAITIGSITLTTADLVVLCGFVIAETAVLKGAKVNFNSDGSVTVEPNYKN